MRPVRTEPVNITMSTVSTTAAPVTPLAAPKVKGVAAGAERINNEGY